LYTSSNLNVSNVDIFLSHVVAMVIGWQLAAVLCQKHQTAKKICCVHTRSYFSVGKDYDEVHTVCNSYKGQPCWSVTETSRFEASSCQQIKHSSSFQSGILPTKPSTRPISFQSFSVHKCHPESIEGSIPVYWYSHMKIF
jgi:hypothetical protein